MKKIKLTLLLTLVMIAVVQQTNAQTQPNPCDSDKVHEFDFWIGEWNVYKPGTDTIVGHNIITPLADGCAIMENWTGSGGSIGSSINKYNFSTQMWEQMWVDNSGSSLHIKGTYKDKKMILENEQPGRSGNGIVKNKITYYNNADGTVRQHWEYSTDKGKTWLNAFDGLYKKVSK